MAFARSYSCAFGALSLLAATATNVAAGAGTSAISSAHMTAQPIVSEASTGRKGTRNYRNDGSSTSTPSTPSTTEYRAPTRAEKLQYCIDTWDAGTHISKSKWREICKRQLAAGE